MHECTILTQVLRAQVTCSLALLLLCILAVCYAPPRMFTLIHMLTPVLCAVCSIAIPWVIQSLVKIIAKHKKPLLVEWYTPTCGHCVRLEPVLTAVAAQFAGKLTVSAQI